MATFNINVFTRLKYKTPLNGDVVKVAWSDDIKILKNQSHYLDLILHIRLRYWCTHLLIQINEQLVIMVYLIHLPQNNAKL